MIKILSQSIFILLITTLPCHAGLVIIGNATSNFDSLSRVKVKNLWLGRVSRLPNGEKPYCVDFPEGTNERNAFIKNILKKNEKQLKAYWTKKSFVRKRYPPETVINSEEVIDWVKSRAGGLGYINESEVTNSVKILYKLK